MSEILTRIVALVGVGEVRISAHGYDELAEDDILAGEVIDGVEAAALIEEYPTYAKGPCVRPVHVVWGIPRGQTSPAVLITAY